MEKYTKGICVEGLEFWNGQEWDSFSEFCCPIDSYSPETQIRGRKGEETYTWGEHCASERSIIPIYYDYNGWQMASHYSPDEKLIYDKDGESHEVIYES